MSRGLIVFVREALPGRVKTRLAGDLGVGAATELYAAMRADVLESASSLADVRLLVFWAVEQGALPVLQELPRLEMFAQKGATLGERMAAAFVTAFASGIRNCCIIGSDSPDLPLRHIEEAFQALEQDRADVVFGPAADGGYYLLGMRRLWGRLFEDVFWSSPQVLETSLERARELNLRSLLLPPWYDLDTIADLRRLAASDGRNAPRTRQALLHLEEQLHSTSKAGSL